MLGANKMIGFVTTRDSQQARKFYEGVLGFKFVSQDQFALVLETEQNMIRISEVKEGAPAPYTILGWEVREIERVADWLKARGVTFERYPWMQQEIWTSPSGDKVAWFKDPDGNVLSISQFFSRKTSE